MKPLIIKMAPLVLLTLAVAGCGGAQGNPSGPGTSTAGAVTTQDPGSGNKVASNPGRGIINSTSMKSCDTKEGKVSAGGTVTPPADAKGVVKVSVSWVDPKTSSVLAQASQTITDFTAGKPADWSVATDLGKAPGEVHCVLGSTILPAG